MWYYDNNMGSNNNKQKILVTGGAGYIGSHTVVELANDGYEVFVVDNLSNSSMAVIDRVEQITKCKVHFTLLDLCDYGKVMEYFKKYKFDAVMHFAGLKAVGESVDNPTMYYHNNLLSTINLLRAMSKHSVKKLIFSSSATVYGEPSKMPITEDFAIQPTNPYGQTKAMIEQILTDLAIADNKLSIISLRYFNPIGAHHSGLIGDDPNGTPNNLLPFVAQVAIGKLSQLKIFGDDYDTIDGTGVRDYIHVVDLAQGHLSALGYLSRAKGHRVYNLGTGVGYSVKQVVQAFKEASGKDIPCQVVARRSGDVAICYANPELAKQELGWEAKLSLETACQDAWRWQSNNPDGLNNH